MSADARSELGALVRGLAAEIERRIELGERSGPAAPGRRTSRAIAPAPTPASTPAQAPAEPTTAQRSPEPARRTAKVPAAGRPVRNEPPGVAENRAKAAGAPDLAALEGIVAACTACSLCRTRKQTVFADGPDAGKGKTRVLFVGEAPGQREDEQGVPFVGPAGQLLTDIIEKGMGLSRAEVTIANVLKCRPPENRDPTPEEKALCTPFLDRQIELVDPEVIVPLGRHAAQHLLGSTDSMGRLRQRVHRPTGRLAGRSVVPTYHPAYLLRSPSMKKDCWADIQLAMGELGLPVPPPKRG